MKNMKFNILKKDSKIIDEISEKFKISRIVATIIANRDLKSSSDIASFLDPYSFIPQNPFLIFNMNRAVDRFNTAIKNNEKITIYGDYDVDGITSVSLMCKFLKEKNANFDYYIPDRFLEGYGISRESVLNIKNKGTSLIITVDCGITAVDEISYAKSIGVDVIVTDHHRCKEIMPDCIVVNPNCEKSNFTFTEFAGVGVAFIFICAIEGIENYHSLLKKYSDLVAIGTIADVMPIRQDNRIIVKAGLKKINTNRACLGVSCLIEHANLKSSQITVSSIAYAIAPRLNAVGRLSSASLAVKLLLTDDVNLAKELSNQLCEENVKRQNTEKDILDSAMIALTTQNDINNDLVFVVEGEKWHHGVIGIVASNILRKFNIPTIIISTENGEGKGSGRSVEKFNMFDALSNCSELLQNFGGHQLAAGISISSANIDSFRKRIKDYAKSVITKDDLVPFLTIDAQVKGESITLDITNSLKILEPYGKGNEQPLFLAKNMVITNIISLTNNKHTKFIFNADGLAVTGMYFDYNNEVFNIGDIVDVVFNLNVNTFREKSVAQMLIRYVKFSQEEL